ncbi:MAG: hypothetical protein HGA62_07445 [Chlorobiaceae bacterium]|nr:hypothetical protein [Chlorobiaceae bacterium]NTV59889.1 hypothetical protein [Chlorobiaceae bacterium]
MFQDVISEVRKAVDSSRHWAETGWQVSFGPRAITVCTLREAEALPRNSVVRLEAQNYWKQAQLTGNDAADWGEKAISALDAGDLKGASDALYFTQYIEKPFSDSSKTWLPLYESFVARFHRN